MTTKAPPRTRTQSKAQRISSADPLWFKDAIIYQLHVRAFCDANGDGIGDFKGLTEKLDYVRDLGVTAIWLQPFFASPLKDDGYDIADYLKVNPTYGTLRDVDVFLREAHARDLRVITELVMNHTSDQHAWFQKSRRAKPGEKWRDYYVWSDTGTEYPDARIIFQDFEVSNWTWDPVAQAYFWHRFYHHQPDLNFDNPEVHDAMLGVIDYWFDRGVDGVRLDAVPYLYEREGTNCENLPETHAFLQKLRAHVDQRYPDKMLLAEANQWPEDAAAYYGAGDECHMNFHFPLMPRLFMAIEREDRFPIIDILEQTPAIPENCQWGIFLRNHDELTLEMVTDEERDYMYRTYADDPRARINLGIRRRLAPLLRDNRRKMELMNALLLSLPGTPVVYYGDEIPMGDNIYLGDRDSVRTPMQWNDDRNAGFSRANPQRLYLPVVIDAPYHYASRNVEVEQSRPHSLLWWTRRIIGLRKQHNAFGRGTMTFLQPKNPKVLVYLREFEGETILVVANLSRHAQCAEIDLSQFRGQTPVELFGQTRFPPIGTLPYFFTLGPYSFYWFRLAWREDESPDIAAELPKCKITGSWDAIFTGRPLQHLEHALPGFLQRHRWFPDKQRPILRTKVVDILSVRAVPAMSKKQKRSTPSTVGRVPEPQILLVQVDFVDGSNDLYVLPVVLAAGEQQQNILGDHPGAGIIHITRDGETVTLCDATREPELWQSLQDAVAQQSTLPGKKGELRAFNGEGFGRICGIKADEELVSQVPGTVNSTSTPLTVSLPTSEKRNILANLGQKFQWKIFRRLEEGPNPDLEVGRYLTEQAKFPSIPELAGGLEYIAPTGECFTLGLVHEFVSNQGTAWRYTRDELQRYLERIEAERVGAPAEELLPKCTPLELAEVPLPQAALDVMGQSLSMAELLGKRTAELHFALAAGTSKEFAPEPFNKLYQRSLYQSIRVQVIKAIDLLRQKQNELLPEGAELAEQLLAREEELHQICRDVKDGRFTALRTRCHGDLHLQHLLFTGKDFLFINLEGETARPLGERRIKTSPLKDVACMMRSFHYASQAVSLKSLSGQPLVEATSSHVEDWLEVWYLWTTAAYLRTYLAAAQTGTFLPADREALATLLKAYIMEKSASELIHELQTRPEWVVTPLTSLLQVMQVRVK